MREVSLKQESNAVACQRRELSLTASPWIASDAHEHSHARPRGSLPPSLPACVPTQILWVSLLTDDEDIAKGLEAARVLQQAQKRKGCRHRQHKLRMGTCDALGDANE